jgi:hypothetical protein
VAWRPSKHSRKEVILEFGTCPPANGEVYTDAALALFEDGDRLTKPISDLAKLYTMGCIDGCFQDVSNKAHVPPSLTATDFCCRRWDRVSICDYSCCVYINLTRTICND